jgi:hypothetical protein
MFRRAGNSLLCGISAPTAAAQVGPLLSRIMLIKEPVLQAGQRDVRLGLDPVEQRLLPPQRELALPMTPVRGSSRCPRAHAAADKRLVNG